MTHTSGIPQLNRKLPTFEEMLRAAATRKLDFPPGTDQEYNNFNSDLLSECLGVPSAKESGK